jgi:hypothetical protein
MGRHSTPPAPAAHPNLDFCRSTPATPGPQRESSPRTTSSAQRAEPAGWRRADLARRPPARTGRPTPTRPALALGNSPCRSLHPLRRPTATCPLTQTYDPDKPDQENPATQAGRPPTSHSTTARRTRSTAAPESVVNDRGQGVRSSGTFRRHPSRCCRRPMLGRSSIRALRRPWGRASSRQPGVPAVGRAAVRSVVRSLAVRPAGVSTAHRGSCVRAARPRSGARVRR